MIDTFTKHVEFDTLFDRILAVANCSSAEELANMLDIGCDLFDQCRETHSVPPWLLILISYKLDISLRCLFDTDCSELITMTKKLEIMKKQITQCELGADQLQKEISQKEAELSNIARVRETFILELTAAKEKLSTILDTVSPGQPS